MRPLYHLLLFSALSTVCSAAPPDGHVLVFEEDYDGPELDPERWTAQQGERRDAMNTPRAVSIKDGKLVLKTFTENGKHYTGFVGSRGKFEHGFGYWEARVRCFTTPGMWSAFWIHSPSMGSPIGDVQRAGAEIDVMEHRVADQSGKDISNLAITTVHWDGYGKEHKSVSRKKEWKDGTALQGNWHTYAVHWAPSGYVFYLDGKEISRIDKGISHRPEFIYLTSEVKDKGWAGNIPKGGYGDDAKSNTRMEVDWVRVWRPAAKTE